MSVDNINHRVTTARGPVARIGEAAQRDQAAITARITAELERANLDAALLTSGDAIFYATGYADSNLYTAGSLGSTVALVTRDGQVSLVTGEFSRLSAEIAAGEGVQIASYPTWIYIDDYAVPGQTKEVQPDLNKTYRQILEFLPETDRKIRLGVQARYLTHAAGEFLSGIFGRENLIDLSEVLLRARAIKTPWEIGLLRRAAHYSELAMEEVARAVTPGWTERDVIAAFNRACFAQSNDVVSVTNAHTIAANFTPNYIPPETRIEAGDVIRLDGGPNVLGYNSDLARTFAVGPKTDPEREKIYEHLWAGYDFAIKNVGPGVAMKDIFNGIHDVLRKRGFEGYIRGHQGHSIGCSQFAEEYPFFAPDSGWVLEPGMVMNLEMPWYSSKRHTFNIEDTFLVTDNGVEWFSMANRSLYL